MSISPLKRYYVLVSVFVTGAIVLAIEILGSRIIGPYYGTSIYVWSALITVTLVALSIGCWFGGYIADRRTNPKILYFLILVAAWAVFTIPLISSKILDFSSRWDIRVGVVLSSLLLFAMPLVLLGTVTPFAIRVLTSELRILGGTVGGVYAISTIGSVFGTILTGFFLIPILSVGKILYLLSAALSVLSLVGVVVFRPIAKRFILLAFLLELAIMGVFLKGKYHDLPLSFKMVYKTNSFYGELKVVDGASDRYFFIDGAVHSRIDRETGETLLKNLTYFEMMPLINPRGERALMIGLGAGSMSKIFECYGMKTDVAEIDPKVASIAKEFFGYRPTGNVFIEDGRSFVRRISKKYDFIVLDAFTSDQYPFYLFTKEGFDNIKKAMNEDGIFGVNSIGFLYEKTAVWKHVFETLSEVFRYVRVFSEQKYSTSVNTYGDIIFLASDRKLEIAENAIIHGRSRSNGLSVSMLNTELIYDGKGIVLRDDYNPIEFIGMHFSCLWRSDMLTSSINKKIFLF